MSVFLFVISFISQNENKEENETSLNQEKHTVQTNDEMLTDY